jgi:hypothetical protein
VLQISRQAIYRVPTPRTAPQRRPVSDPVEQAIVEVAEANQTDGYWLRLLGSINAPSSRRESLMRRRVPPDLRPPDRA